MDTHKDIEKVELLLRVIAPSLSDIAEFQKRLAKVCDEVHPTGQKRSLDEGGWRGYFIVVFRRNKNE